MPSTQLYYPQTHVLTVCPDDYVPRNGCVTPDDLNNNLKSNTTYRFVPAFKMLPNQVIRFKGVDVMISNIILDTAGPDKSNISCLGENSGFYFESVYGLTIRNLQFINCAMKNIPYTYPSHHFIDCTVFIWLSADIKLDNVVFEQGKPGAYSVLGTKVHGNITISNATFRHLQGPALFIEDEHPCTAHVTDLMCTKQWQVMIRDSVFSNCTSDRELNTYVSFTIGLISCGPYYPQAPNVRISNVSVTNNTHYSQTHGILIDCTNNYKDPEHNNSPHNVIIVLEKFRYENNHALRSEISSTTEGNSEIALTISYHNYILLSDLRLLNNTGPAREDSYSLLEFRGSMETPDPDLQPISLTNVTICNNFGHSSVIKRISEWDCAKTDHHHYHMSYLNISGNVFNTTLRGKTGLIHFQCAIFITMRNCSIENNIHSETGILLEDSHLYFNGINIIKGNTGYKGGGMSIYGTSELTIDYYTPTRLYFEDNFARNLGGGMYVNVEERTWCWFDVGLGQVWGTIVFNNNYARTAGNDIYGGSLQKCKYTIVRDLIGWEAMVQAVQVPKGYIIDVTSDPLHVCDCSTESVEDCMNNVPVIHHIEAYPGETFSLQLVVVGQLLNTTTFSGVPSPVYAGILPLHSNNTATIPQGMRVQNAMRRCSKLNFSVSSTDRNEVMALAVNDNLHLIPDYFVQLWNTKDHAGWASPDLTVPAFVTIELSPCPVGFELSKQAGECQCASALLEHVVSCDINTKLLMKKPLAWVSDSQEFEDFLHLHDNSSLLYLTHSRCPFNFCYSSDEFEFDMEKSDSQCRHNRSGILCGECNNHSLTLGSMECRQCTNIYLLLLVPFALAGILLILFLSLTDMTVAAGTINGLLFYANIVWGNKATFFPPETGGDFLAVFIAWLNLDLGISTCFYDGLDSYLYTWLQFSFPIYIWFLAFLIIIASRYSSFVNKICGRNIVQVLATLFLLSYTKLQRTIVTGLTFTAIDMSNGGKFYVWLQDGNVLYLQGKHIALFVVSILFLLILFIPYTFSIALGPWLQTKTQYRVFWWVLKLKPFFDAYFGPFKDKHRYWTGVLLLSRMILSLISILDHAHINLLSITTFILVLLVFLLWKERGGIYKMKFLTLLDVFFFINLCLLASATFYSEVSNENKHVSVSISTGATFAMFCLIILCHVIKKIWLLCTNKRNINFEQLLLERDGHSSSSGSEDSDDALLNFLDVERELPDVTVTHRHSTTNTNKDTL